MATLQQTTDARTRLVAALATPAGTLAAMDAVDRDLADLCAWLKAGDPKPSGGPITVSPGVILDRGAAACLRGINQLLK